MRKIFLSVLIFLSITSEFLPNGVAIANRALAQYLRLTTTNVECYSENQVAIVTATQTYYNQFTSARPVDYAFPLPQGASATRLRWNVNGEWYQATIAPGSYGGGSGGGGGPDPNPTLTAYLGPNPVFFTIPQPVQPENILIVEITYVQLLPYTFGNIYFNYPNKYTTIQTLAPIEQRLTFSLYSQRLIDSIRSVNHTPISIVNHGDSAKLTILLNNLPASADFSVKYTLSLSQLGLFSMSTFLNDSASIHDTIQGGYFLFVVEPPPSAQVIKKVFVLILDRSGSMGWENKMQQAKNAAVYIVQNMNEGDKFNIVDFATDVTTFKPQPVFNSPANVSDAVTYINSKIASGSTNISGAFSTALPQFSSVTDSTANIIVFLTDGQATVGILGTNAILSHIQSLVNTNPHKTYIFCFGIGSDVNRQLLSSIASRHFGLAEYLENSQLEEKLIDFYNRIKNPVLISPQLSYTPATLESIYPDTLPNLYLGQQLLVGGRYFQTNPVNLTFSGEVYGQQVSYNYTLNLADTPVNKNQFVPKIWAKLAIEDMYALYNTFPPNSPTALELKAQIIWLSVKYNVISPFTIFTTNLPVELAAFKAVLVGNFVELFWQTATETNNFGFEIERRLGNGEWEVIGFLKGKGTITTVQNYHFRDDLSRLKFSGKIHYRLRQIDFDGSFAYSEIVTVFYTGLVAPEQFELSQNYPNPFNPSTKISFILPVDSHISLFVNDLLGRKLSVIREGHFTAGVHTVDFSPDNLSSGVYLYTLDVIPSGSNSVTNSITKKMTYLK